VQQTTGRILTIYVVRRALLKELPIGGLADCTVRYHFSGINLLNRD